MKQPITDERIYIDLQPIEAFISACKRDIFTDDDGYGFWACMDGAEPMEDPDEVVIPSKIVQGLQKPPYWATHVNWISR